MKSILIYPSVVSVLLLLPVWGQCAHVELRKWNLDHGSFSVAGAFDSNINAKPRVYLSIRMVRPSGHAVHYGYLAAVGGLGECADMILAENQSRKAGQATTRNEKCARLTLIFSEEGVALHRPRMFDWVHLNWAQAVEFAHVIKFIEGLPQGAAVTKDDLQDFLAEAGSASATEPLCE